MFLSLLVWMDNILYTDISYTRTSVRSRAPCSRPAGWLWDLRSTFTPKALDMIHTQLSHSSKITFSQKSIFPNKTNSEYYIIPFSQNLIFPKSHIPEILFPEILSSEIPFSQNHIFPESFSQNQIFPKKHFPAIPFSCNPIFPKSHF